ncbi:MAG TPA: reverse transcriptase domain-containing protein [Candidatus Hydrogenedentes bacterium]|nr:reverse transcriptase domain-containing protein [Candidatus Hydrogenedentota bacterium]
MRRHGNLYPRIASFENVLRAARQAQRCKRYRGDVLAFNHDIEQHAIELTRELETMTYCPGAYKTFVIYEPKRRLISAAPYRDRVVHHALCNVIEPIVDRTFVDSCYANRIGKGTHKALDHFTALARRYRYCLHADVEKYFPSIDHAILRERIRRHIKCPNTLSLIDAILENSNEQEPAAHYFPGDDLLSPYDRRKGLPIGNLTSQLWANLYLARADHVMAQRFGGTRYLRYVDDIAVFSDSADELTDARTLLKDELALLRLNLHPVKTQISRVSCGVNFLGFRVFPDRVRLRQENLRRARKRMRGLRRSYASGSIGLDAVTMSIQSWVAHVSYGDTWRLRERVLEGLVFRRAYLTH